MQQTKKNRITNRKRTNRKRALVRGGNPIKCCMCDTAVTRDIASSLVPQKCLQKYGERAHRICTNCWFKPDGFVTEGVNHACPGCKKGFPLTDRIKAEPTKIIDMGYISSDSNT